MSGRRSTASAPPYGARPRAERLPRRPGAGPAHIAHAPSCSEGVSPHSSRARSQPPPQDPSPRGVRRACVCVITLRHCSSLGRWRQPFLVGPPRAPRLGLLAGLGVSLRWGRARVCVCCCWRAFLGCCSRARGPPLPPCIPQSTGPHICPGSCAYCGCMGQWVGPR